MRPLLVLAALCLTASALQDQRSERAIAAGLDFVARADEPEPGLDVDEELSRHMERSARIEAELDTLDNHGDSHEWAGLYYQGDGTGRNVTLLIAPESGAAYSWMGCLGMYDLNHGEIVSVTPEGIELALAVDPRLNKRWYPAGLARRYLSSRWIPVRWGPERFLIPECQIIPFCNDVNGGGAAAGFPRQKLDPDASWRERARRPEGLPELPSTYAPFLLVEPLTTSIREASEPRLIGEFTSGPLKYAVSARIELGLEHGLLPGMLLHAIEPERQGTGEVLSAEPDAATLEFRFALFDHARDVPRAGWRLSTRWRQRE